MTQPHTITRDQNFDRKSFPVVRTILGVDQITRMTVALALCVFEQGAFEIQVNSVRSDLVLERQQMSIYELTGRLESAVQVKCSQNGLKSITQDRRPFTTASKIFFSTETKEITDADVAALFCEYGLADEQRFDPGQVALPLVRVASEEVFSHDEVEDGIAKELQSFVGCYAFL